MHTAHTHLGFGASGCSGRQVGGVEHGVGVGASHTELCGGGAGDAGWGHGIAQSFTPGKSTTTTCDPPSGPDTVAATYSVWDTTGGVPEPTHTERGGTA